MEEFEKLRDASVEDAEDYIRKRISSDKFFRWAADDYGKKFLVAAMLSYLESIKPENSSFYNLMESTWFRLDKLRRQLRYEDCSHLFVDSEDE